MKDLDGRVAVVTGAASGIGRAVATCLAAAGMRLALADIDESALQTTTAELTRNGYTVHGIPTDVSNPDSVDHLAETVWSTYGDVHVLHNNAGVGLAGQGWMQQSRTGDGYSVSTCSASSTASEHSSRA